MVILNTFVNSLLHYSYDIESLQSPELVFVHPSTHFFVKHSLLFCVTVTEQGAFSEQTRENSPNYRENMQKE